MVTQESERLYDDMAMPDVRYGSLSIARTVWFTQLKYIFDFLAVQNGGNMVEIRAFWKTVNEHVSLS